MKTVQSPVIVTMLFALSAPDYGAGDSLGSESSTFDIAATHDLGIEVSLNLFLNDPVDQNKGGDWNLVAKSDLSHGIAAMVVELTNIDNGTTDITLADGIGAMATIGGKPPWLTAGSHTELIYGQDLSDPTSVVVGVGTPMTSDGLDPLGDPAWDDATLIASGTFGPDLPVFTAAAGNVLSISSAPFRAEAVDLATVIRISAVLGDLDKDGTVEAGDIDVLTAALRGGPVVDYFDLDRSMITDFGDVTYLVETLLGTRFGDADLNGTVTASGDGAVVLANLGGIQGNKGWGDADFDGDGNVTASADAATLLSNLGSDTTAVPEPSAMLQVILALLGARLGKLRLVGVFLAEARMESRVAPHECTTSY